MGLPWAYVYKNLPFQTIIFDDPSQSLGSQHKEKLAELLYTIADTRQVIVSTLDDEFWSLVKKYVTLPSVHYNQKAPVVIGEQT